MKTEKRSIMVKEMVLMGVFSTFVMDLGYVFIKLTKIVEPSMQPYHLGRWLLSMLQGTFMHADIGAVEAFGIEKPVALIAHYLTGIILVNAFLWLKKNTKVFSGSIFMGILFGLVTVVFPWFVMYPAMGFGFLGLDGPGNSNNVLFGLLNHSFFGIGITFWMWWVRKFTVKSHSLKSVRPIA
ncbi:MAG: DUF2938 family protein [Deltaproteobacteria bacterium]|nr:DUF2938 family protein [Deltaproteobacteria bacterium]